MDSKMISIVKTTPEYPNKSDLYRPSERYAEYQFDEISQRPNYVYAAVREAFMLMGLDKDNYGKKSWNPLSTFVKPGNTVLIKPNLVMDVNGNRSQGTECLYTHPSVVAAVIDYVLIALNGTGKIVIGDAPMQECVFSNIVENGGYGQLVEYYKKKEVDIKIVDFRELTSKIVNGVHVASINENSKGTVIDLKDQSEFHGASKSSLENIRITNYDPRILTTHHYEGVNEYYISDYILDADVIINMPKPKSHRKAGVTISLKNFVGANVRKEYLPHHTMGSIEEGGDEYLSKDRVHAIKSYLLDKKNICESEKRYTSARLIRLLVKTCSVIMKLKGTSKYQEGSWYGNNTISRTISDINKIVKYSDKNGIMQEAPQRKMLIVADMIISGENEGPVYPTRKPVGIIAAGSNPVSFDRAITALMGFSPNLIPTINVAENISGKYKLASDGTVGYVSNDPELDGKLWNEISRSQSLCFEPSSGWKGHIES